MQLVRQLLRNDVLAEIKAKLASGIWKDSLPSERQLTEEFQVSRGTLRYALKVLKEEGVIESLPGSGYRILRKLDGRPSKIASVSIGILIGSSDGKQDSRSLPWIPELQKRISKREWNLHVHEGIPEICRSPKTGLQKLFRATHHSCWLLVRCSQPVQQAFCDQRVPAIICGSPYRGIDLPSIDVNYQALGRHAAGLLASKGHRRIGYARSRTAFPGDSECFKCFTEAAAKSSISPKVRVTRFKDSSHHYGSLLAQVKAEKDPITALFVDCPYQLARIYTEALQAHIKIPEKLSILSREESDFLDYLSPFPARYACNSKKQASRIHRLIEERVQGDILKNHRTLLLPEYISGKSLISIDA